MLPRGLAVLQQGPPIAENETTTHRTHRTHRTQGHLGWQTLLKCKKSYHAYLPACQLGPLCHKTAFPEVSRPTQDPMCSMCSMWWSMFAQAVNQETLPMPWWAQLQEEHSPQSFLFHPTCTHCYTQAWHQSSCLPLSHWDLASLQLASFLRRTPSCTAHLLSWELQIHLRPPHQRTTRLKACFHFCVPATVGPWSCNLLYSPFRWLWQCTCPQHAIPPLSVAILG